MRKLRLLSWAVFFTVLPTLAYADPISTAIVTWVASAAFAATTAGAIVIGALDLAFSAGLSYIANALAGKPKTSPLGVKGQLQAGGAIPRSFIVGYGSTAGLLCYANTWGNTGKTPNAYLTQVIKLSDIPVSSLEQVWVFDSLVTYGSGTPDADKGYAIPEYNTGGKDYLWVKFYDGTQTTADSFLTSTFGSDPSYPYDSGRKGIGIAYVIVTALINETLFSGFPKYNFACNGAKLYDPRLDSTNGGTGSQRFDDASTWAFTLNPMVILYHILRGLNYSGDWFYGLQSLTAKRLPSASWFAAMNECDLSVDTNAGGTEAQYRCGGEISVDVQPADAMDGILMACNGRVAEIGGIYKAQAGASGSAVLSFSDADLLSTEQQTFDQFPDLQSLVNGITATYPEPAQEWASTDAPALYNSDYEAADGDRQLISDVSYDLVPFAEQVQRLMKSALAEARRFRKHVIPFPPDGWALEPLDVISWTSARNGYSAKAFRCDLVTDQDNLDLILSITEVDPSDYDWDATTDFKPYSLGTLTIQRPAAQTLAGWSLTGTSVVGDGGRERAALELQWGTDVDDVTGVQYQIRLTADSSIVLEGETDYWDSGVGLITQNILSDTAYQGRARYRSASSRDFDWTDWLDATTPDIRLSAIDLYDEAVDWPAFSQSLKDMMEFIGDGARNAIDEILLLSQGANELAIGSASDLQVVRTDIVSTYDTITAEYTEQITVATGPDSAIVQRLTTLEATSGAVTAEAFEALTAEVTTQGDTITSQAASILSLTTAITDPSTGLSANASAVSALSATVTSQGSTITSQGSSITSLTSTVGNFSASGLFRVSTNSALNGASSTIALAAAATSGGSASTAALYMSAMSGGTSQIILSADKVYMTDGTNFQTPFVFTGGSLFVNSAVIPNLDAGIITAGTINVARINGLTAAQLTAGAANAVAGGTVASGTLSSSYVAIDTLSISYTAGSRSVRFSIFVILGSALSGIDLQIRMTLTGGVLNGVVALKIFPAASAGNSTLFDTELRNYSTISETISCKFEISVSSSTKAYQALIYADQPVR